MPGSAGWWWFDRPLDIQTTPEGQGLAAILWNVDEDGVLLASFVFDEKHGPMLSGRWTWPHDATWAEAMQTLEKQELLMWTRTDLPQAKAKEAFGTIGRIFLGGCAWLQQRVVSVGGGHVERHRRKQLAREQSVDVQREVKVIQLRRTERAGSPSAERVGDAPEWSCRWVVSGHWRNQFYAKTSDHKLIYIMPFVKGPEGKPMKVASHTVYSVNR